MYFLDAHHKLNENTVPRTLRNVEVTTFIIL